MGDALTGPLRPGSLAPAFDLKATPWESVALSDFRGRPLVLVFYPCDWDPVSVDQLGQYQENLPLLEAHGARLAAVSVDGVWSHMAFGRQRGLEFALLSDFEPKGSVARAYGVYRPDFGMSSRALFVIDQRGVVRWSYLSPPAVNPGLDGILTALEALGAAERLTGAR